MNFIVFESGSRAGLSAELFFEDYVKRNSVNHTLYLSDLDEDFKRIAERHPQVKRIHDSRALEMLKAGDAVVFPADEITRQVNDLVAEIVTHHSFSRVKPSYYNKNAMNHHLAPLTAGCSIKVPATFSTTNVCIRPNTRSAGSRNVQLLDNACVTQRIDIMHEYVVDVLRYDDTTMHIFPREVTLKNGYDRFIKLLPLDGELASAVREFILAACPANDGPFSDIFHLQLCQDTSKQLYYIEFSKRISGTSCVNIATGMNPFALIDSVEPELHPQVIDDKWRRFEDFLIMI